MANFHIGSLRIRFPEELKNSETYQKAWIGQENYFNFLFKMIYIFSTGYIIISVNKNCTICLRHYRNWRSKKHFPYLEKKKKVMKNSGNKPQNKLVQDSNAMFSFSFKNVFITINSMMSTITNLESILPIFLLPTKSRTHYSPLDL